MAGLHVDAAAVLAPAFLSMHYGERVVQALQRIFRPVLRRKLLGCHSQWPRLVEKRHALVLRGSTRSGSAFLLGAPHRTTFRMDLLLRGEDATAFEKGRKKREEVRLIGYGCCVRKIDYFPDIAKL